MQTMATGKILAICQTGGEFVTNSDGTMSYAGGEAHAIDIDSEMTLNDLKSEISVMFNCNVDVFSIKYFLPRNKKTLITISNDKDLRRMVDYHAGSDTTDIYLLKKTDNRIIKSVVADSGNPIDVKNVTLATLDDTKRRRVSASWGSLITGVGQVFSTSKAFRDVLHKYAIANSFMYRFIKNDSSRVTAECTVEGCPWRIHASKSSNKQEFIIKKINDAHTCGKELSKESRRLASQRWVAGIIKDKLKDSPDYKPKDIATDLQREYGLNLNYSQAWRGRFIAKKELHNSHEEACAQLPWFCERIMETNPGSVATLQKMEDSRFRLFVAFHASLSGFEHGCRPLIFLDGVTLKANKQCKLLSATAVDGENDIFPVAMAVVEAESNHNWHWFLQQLKSAFTMSRTMTFISNGENGLEEEVPKIFEDGCHGYCVQQLIDNFKAEMDDSWTQETKDEMLDHLKGAVYSCKIDEFNEHIEAIKTQSQELSEWILATKPDRWSNALFKGLRYGNYSSDIADKLNSWVSTRYEPSVVQIVDMIRCNMMEMMYTRRESSNSWTEALIPSVDQKLQEDIEKSRALNVVCSTGSVFEVRDETVNVVNIETWECTCRRWQVTGLPCVHALAVLERTDASIYNYCSKYFSTECYRISYSLSINPIPDIGRPTSGNELSDSPFTCPTRTRRKAGRPKLKPEDPRISIKRAVRCSKCQGFGHNKQTCKTQA